MQVRLQGAGQTNTAAPQQVQANNLPPGYVQLDFPMIVDEHLTVRDKDGDLHLMPGLNAALFRDGEFVMDKPRLDALIAQKQQEALDQELPAGTHAEIDNSKVGARIAKAEGMSTMFGQSLGTLGAYSLISPSAHTSFFHIAGVPVMPYHIGAAVAGGLAIGGGVAGGLFGLKNAREAFNAADFYKEQQAKGQKTIIQGVPMQTPQGIQMVPQEVPIENVIKALRDKGVSGLIMTGAGVCAIAAGFGAGPIAAIGAMALNGVAALYPMRSQLLAGLKALPGALWNGFRHLPGAIANTFKAAAHGKPRGISPLLLAGGGAAFAAGHFMPGPLSLPLKLAGGFMLASSAAYPFAYGRFHRGEAPAGQVPQPPPLNAGPNQAPVQVAPGQAGAAPAPAVEDGIPDELKPSLQAFGATLGHLSQEDIAQVQGIEQQVLEFAQRSQQQGQMVDVNTTFVQAVMQYCQDKGTHVEQTLASQIVDQMKANKEDVGKSDDELNQMLNDRCNQQLATNQPYQALLATFNAGIGYRDQYNAFVTAWQAQHGVGGEVAPQAVNAAAEQPNAAAPVAPQAAPVAPQAAPVAPQAAPVAPQAAPVAPQAAPVVPQAAPVTAQGAPVVPEAAPVAAQAAPVATTLPPAPEQAPVAAVAAEPAPAAPAATQPSLIIRPGDEHKPTAPVKLWVPGQ
jgi:hypothetical protein